jgi:hypothetical protein
MILGNRAIKFTQLAVLLVFCASQAFSQVWTQLAPTGSSPPAGAGVGGLDQTDDRMVIVYPNGNPQTSWVLTNADGLGGTPQWLSFATLPDPVYGAAPSRGELPTAVYDATSNRVITFAGCTGNCGSATNDVWVLTNANGLGGTPSWLKLAPSGALPPPRASHSAAYDPGSNRMIVFGGQDGCCAQPHSFGDVWVLTNANGLGGAPAWIQLSPAGGPPAGQSEIRVVYDTARNRLTVFGGWPYASNIPTNAVWELSNANGLGGAPAWTNLIPEGSSGSPPGRGFQGAVYDPPTNHMIVFAGQAPPTSTLYNDTWTLSGANGIGPAAWTQLSTMGGPPAARDYPLAVLNASSNRMTIWGGGGATGSFNDVWVLTNANGTGGGQGTLTLFSDNFNSYDTSVGLAGQGGWFQDSSNTAPLMLSTSTPLGPSVAVDGLHRTGTGAYNGTSFALVRHTLSGPLNPNGISILSVDAYAFNAYSSHASGIGLESADSAVNIEAYAAWYASHSPAWQFNSSLPQSDFFYGAFDQPVRLEIVIDGSAGTYYDRLVYSTGVYETPHHAITSAQIANLTQVILFEDFRDVYLGVDLDNVLVTTTAAANVDDDSQYSRLNGGNTFTGNQTVNGTVAATSFVGNGAGLTGVAADTANTANFATTANFANAANIANTAGFATNAGTATNASSLCSVPAASYARLDIANNFSGNQTVTGNLSASGNLAVSGSATIGGGTPIIEHLSATPTVTVPPIAPSNCATISNVSVPGASDGDTLALGVKNSLVWAGSLNYFAWVSAPNTVTIRVCNFKGGSSNPQITGIIRVDIWKH